MRNVLLLGAVAILAVGGGVWTYYREGSSPCENDFFVSRVHDEMREEFFEESLFFAALQDGAAADTVSDADRATYAAASEKLVNEINSAKVVGRSQHPSYKELQTCRLTLHVANPLAEFDLKQSSFLGMATDRDFTIVARFKINFEEITGVELMKRVDAQRNDQFVVETETSGDLIMSARMAKLTRRAFDLHEPEFEEMINYNTSVEVPEGIEPGYIGR